MKIDHLVTPVLFAIACAQFISNIEGFDVSDTYVPGKATAVISFGSIAGLSGVDTPAPNSTAAAASSNPGASTPVTSDTSDTTTSTEGGVVSTGPLNTTLPSGPHPPITVVTQTVTDRECTASQSVASPGGGSVVPGVAVPQPSPVAHNTTLPPTPQAPGITVSIVASSTLAQTETETETAGASLTGSSLAPAPSKSSTEPPIVPTNGAARIKILIQAYLMSLLIALTIQGA